MSSNGVELLKYQFSKAIDQTFERFLDAWTLPIQDEPAIGSFTESHEAPAEIPAINSF
jgi:hypothetical protein